jgi:dipeptidyl aminopeptidase/acylaminoacyl peptidase
MNFLGNLWTLPATGGTATRTTSLQQDTAYPDWSPDGKTIAFQSYKSGTFHIWAMNPDGSNVRQLTSGFYDDREQQFSPDGTQIVFSSDRPPVGSLAGTAERSRSRRCTPIRRTRSTRRQGQVKWLATPGESEGCSGWPGSSATSDRPPKSE